MNSLSATAGRMLVARTLFILLVVLAAFLPQATPPLALFTGIVFAFVFGTVYPKQVKKTQTFDKLTTARSALRKHEAAREAGHVVLPKDITVGQWLTTWMNDVVKLNRATTTAYSYQQIEIKH